MWFFPIALPFLIFFFELVVLQQNIKIFFFSFHPQKSVIQQVLWLSNPYCTVPHLPGPRALPEPDQLHNLGLDSEEIVLVRKSCEKVCSFTFLSLQDFAAWDRISEKGVTQGFNLETSWTNINVERLMPEHSDNKETELHLTLNPMHDLVDLTASQLRLLLIIVFRRWLHHSSKNIWKNVAFWFPSRSLDIRGHCFTTSNLNWDCSIWFHTLDFMLYLIPSPSYRWTLHQFSYSSS